MSHDVAVVLTFLSSYMSFFQAQQQCLYPDADFQSQYLSFNLMERQTHIFTYATGCGSNALLWIGKIDARPGKHMKSATDVFA